MLAPECYERTDAFPWFKANTQPGALDELIAEGVDGRFNFFAKREIIDEFGWRNFGDIFADHETLYQNEGGTLDIPLQQSIRCNIRLCKAVCPVWG